MKATAAAQSAVCAAARTPCRCWSCPRCFRSGRRLASLLPSAACDVYVFHHSAAGVLYSGGEDANGFLSEAVVCSMPLDRASLAELYALWMNMDADSLVTADGSLLLLRGEEGLYIVS